MKILILEPVRVRAEAVTAALSRSMHLAPEIASSVEEALAVIRRGGVDLVLCDLRGGGIAAVRQLAEVARAPVVALAATEVEARDSIDAGATRVLPQEGASLALAVEVELLIAWAQRDSTTVVRREVAEVRALLTSMELSHAPRADRRALWSLEALTPRERWLAVAGAVGTVAVVVVSLSLVGLAALGVDVGPLLVRLTTAAPGVE